MLLTQFVSRKEKYKITQDLQNSIIHIYLGLKLCGLEETVYISNGRNPKKNLWSRISFIQMYNNLYYFHNNIATSLYIYNEILYICPYVDARDFELVVINNI